MVTQNGQKSILHRISYQGDNLVLELHHHLSPNEKADSIKEFILVERHSERQISFSLEQVGFNGETLFLKSVLPSSIFADLINNGLYWDAYIQIENKDIEEGFQRLRIRSSIQELELLFYYDKQREKLLIPYTTNKGSLSIKIKELMIIARVEKATLSKDGIMVVEGYSYHPDYDGRELALKRQFVLKDKDDTIKASYNVTDVNRKDLNATYGHHGYDFEQSGFRVEINVHDLLKEHFENISLTATMEYVLNDFEKSIAESFSLKFNALEDDFTPSANIVKFGNRKQKIRLSRTKSVGILFVSSREYILKQEVKRKIKNALYKIKKCSITQEIYKNLFLIIGMFPAKKNLIIFESYLGKQYSCNPRAIYEYIKENYPEYEMYWGIDNRFIGNFINKDVNYLKRFSIPWLFKMARAKYWVVNSRLPLWIPKPKHTVYLQTWHGTPLKKLAADMDEVHMPGTTTTKYKRNFIFEAGRWDYLISPNSYSTEIFERAFMFGKKIIESGYPRNDFLFQANNPESIRKLKEKYGIPLDKKIILYAPTWRDNQFSGKGKYKFDLELDINDMQERLGNEYILILRMHYLVSENLDISSYEGFAYDYSQHEDIRELYLISDILITDYSSVFFDYGNLKRPMLFFVYDIDSYRDNLRGFYFDFEKQAPGPLLKTTEEIISSIKQIEKDGFSLSPSYQAFYDKFCYLESGQSSKRVVEEVFNKK